LSTNFLRSLNVGRTTNGAIVEYVLNLNDSHNCNATMIQCQNHV